MIRSSINKNTLRVFILTGMLTICSYIVLPFLAVYFTEKNISISKVGLILGISSFTSSFSCIISPFFEKILGTKISIIISVFIIAICYFLISITENYVAILFIVILQGIGQGIVNPLLKKSVAMFNKGNENISFRYRYIILCIAIIIGPIIGNILNILGVDIMLKIVAVGCIISCFSMSGLSNFESVTEKTIEKKEKDKINFSILIFIIWSILVFTVFSVFESVSPLAIQPYSTNAEKLFSIMIILNSILAIVLQPVIILLNDKLELKYQLMIGSLAFSIAYIWFAYSKGNFINLMLATTIFTVGEAVLIPMLDVLIGKISDDKKLTGVYAISEIKQLGFFIGPVLTTKLIQQYNVKIMYWIVALVCIFSMFISLIILKFNQTSDLNSYEKE